MWIVGYPGLYFFEYRPVIWAIELTLGVFSALILSFVLFQHLKKMVVPK